MEMELKWVSMEGLLNNLDTMKRNIRNIKMAWIVILNSVFSILIAQYEIGELIVESDQNLTFETCYPGNGYESGDTWKLADWNGALNGGDYNVIVIFLDATWCSPCWDQQNSSAGTEWQHYVNNDHVKFLSALSDPGQPYSCSMWGNAPDGGGAQIIIDEDYELFELYNAENVFPSLVWIDHEMRIHALESGMTFGPEISERIEEMLEACDVCQDNIYVPEEYVNIQSAIENSHTGDTIWVAPGTFSGDGNMDLDFEGKNISLIAEVPYETIIDCEGNERGITFSSGENSTSLFDGFKIINGARTIGGGIYIEDSSPTIRNCWLTNCTASDGGGMFIMNSNSIITNMVITENEATNAGGGVAIYQAAPILSNMMIIGNEATPEELAGGGGGMILQESNATLSNIVISGNSSDAFGGGLIIFQSNDILSNILISVNNAYSNGGGIIIQGVGNLTLSNLTIANNMSQGHVSAGDCLGPCGGGLFALSEDFIMTNTIIWDNIYESIIIYASPNPTMISYSDIDGGFEGEGNINADPLFVLPSSGNYNLMEGSPCIGTGLGGVDMGYSHEYNEDTSCPDIGDINADGNFNVLDIVALANCVLGSNCFTLENSCAGDINGDGNYNVLDIVALANCVLGSNCSDLGRLNDASGMSFFKAQAKWID